MTYRASYNDTRNWRQSGSWTTSDFADAGEANAQTHDVTFARQFAVAPNVQVFVHGNPTLAFWSSNVTATGFTINAYRTSGTASYTIRWVADAPTQ